MSYSDLVLPLTCYTVDGAVPTHLYSVLVLRLTPEAVAAVLAHIVLYYLFCFLPVVNAALFA